MPRRTFTRRAVTRAILALGALPLLPRPGYTADTAGRVNAASGRATGVLDGAVRDLGPESEIFVEDRVQTEAKARLRLEFGQARIDLGEATRLKIEARAGAQGGGLSLERGALLYNGAGGAAEDGVVVRTPFAVVAARDARFFVGPSAEVVGVFSERGRVEVRNDAGAVVLKPGEGTDLIAADVAPTPPARWGPARIEAAMASVS